MCLNTIDLQEQDFAKWQLEVGKGGHTDEGTNINFPDYFKCPQNTVTSLIDTIYPGIYNQAQHSDEYFSEKVILASDVDDFNHHILDKKKKKFLDRSRSFTVQTLLQTMKVMNSLISTRIFQFNQLIRSSFGTLGTQSWSPSDGTLQSQHV